MWQLARTPRWIGFLVLALAVAAGFAALGQWQLSRAVASGTVIERSTESVVALDSVAKPQLPVTDKAEGQLVTVSGSLVPGTATILSGRLNGGTSGYWVMAELHVTGDDGVDGASLAVALGWAPSRAAATSAASTVDTDSGPQDYTGRFLNTEDPTTEDFEHGERKTASVPALINEWTDAPTSVYTGYLVDSGAFPGLDRIDSPKPSTQVTLNLLNVFYAIEWVVFAGFAVFMWYRLLKDRYERDLEEAAELADVN